MARASRKKKDKVRSRSRNSKRGQDKNPRFRAACRSWAIGEFEPAAAGFRETLEQAKGDPWFARYWLASCLFRMRSFDELGALLHRLDDDSGIWRFAQALYAFRERGDTDDARRMLVEADHLEPGFEDYLLRDAVVDACREVRFNADAEERASGCARLFLPAWRGVPGAASWARRVLKVPPHGADRDNVRRQFPRVDLQSLPMRRETWQVGLMLFPDEPHDDTPMWLFGVTNIQGAEVRAMTVIDQQLTETVAWNELMPSFLGPMDGEPALPGTLVVCRRDFCEAWSPLLKEIGVRCRFEADPQPVGQLLKAMGDIVKQHETADDGAVDIRELPQTDAVWQAAFFRSPAWVMNEQEGSYRPWSVLVLEKSRSSALLTDHATGSPSPEMLLEFLVRAMARPGGESAQRPKLVEVADSDCYDHLRPRLEAAGVACRLVDELHELDDFCLRLASSLDASEKCSLADGKGVTRAQMESFYDAAELYFKRAPWQRTPGDVPIQVRCDDPAMGTRYAIVLGRTGVQLGLCIYDDWRMTTEMLSGMTSAEEIRGLAVCYDEAEIMAAVDLQLIERLGWPIAAPEAFPAVMRLQAGRRPRSASADELVFLDACLRSIPDFLEKGANAQAKQIETGTRPVELHLAWKRR